jgi:anti-anti-sigma factor
MPVEKWSDDVWLVHLATDPQFTDEMGGLDAALLEKAKNVVLDFAGVQFVTSSNLARLLRLRKRLADEDKRLVLCALPKKVADAMHVTALDRVFESADSVPTALAMIQMGV